MVRRNLAYPVYPGVYACEKPEKHAAYKPAYPVIREAACRAAEEGRDSARSVAEELLEDMLGSS